MGFFCKIRETGQINICDTFIEISGTRTAPDFLEIGTELKVCLDFGSFHDFAITVRLLFFSIFKMLHVFMAFKGKVAHCSCVLFT